MQVIGRSEEQGGVETLAENLEHGGPQPAEPADDPTATRDVAQVKGETGVIHDEPIPHTGQIRRVRRAHECSEG